MKDSEVDEDDALLHEIDQKLMTEAGLTYDKEYKTIDMGKFRATNYKFNKMVHLPDADPVEKEAKHEIRKVEMLKVSLYL